MVHKIEFNNRNSVIDCFLPKDSVPDKNAVAELYQMTALEETSYVKKLDEAVKEAKRNREWRHEYMTLLMRDQANVKKGEEMLAKLIKMLYEDNRISDIVKVSQDKEYRQKLYTEYHII